MNLIELHRLRSSYASNWDQDKLEAAVRAAEPDFLERVLAVLPEPAERFPADIGEAMRSPVDIKLTSLCELFRRGTPEQRTFIVAMMDATLGGKLQAFSLRMATLGVADRSPDLVRLGVVAHAVEDLAAGDVRDNLCQLAVLVDAARRVGADPVALFREVADLAMPAMAQVLRDYVASPARISSLSAMGYRAVETPEGLRYRQVGWAPPR